MVAAMKGLKHGGLTLLVFLLAFICAAQAAYPPSADISVSKVAQVNGIPVQEVYPGETFYYNITVTNTDLTNAAPDIVVTDKLPWDVTYVSSTVSPATLDYTLNKSGDLLQVRFNEIAANSHRNINITVRAPTDTPTTLYNIVNMRYGNDPDLTDNTVTLTTYVRWAGYDQTTAAKSFEDLLHNQSQLLADFEDLLHTLPNTQADNYTFLASFEQLLRSQAILTSGFEEFLTNSAFTGWDSAYSTVNRTYLLNSYRQMLWDQAFLFASFHMKFNDSWMSMCSYTAPGHTQDAQTEFIASFEDLLKRQARLYKSFDLLLNKINTATTPSVAHSDLIAFLGAYENLLRVEANLLMDFNQKLSWKYEGLNPCGSSPTPPGCSPLTIGVAYTKRPAGGHIYDITLTNLGSTALTVSDLRATFSGSAIIPSTVLTVFAAPWSLIGASPYRIAQYAGAPITVNPGTPVTVSLDYIYADPLAVGSTSFIDTAWSVTTSCGTSATTSRSDNVLARSSPSPDQPTA